MTIAERQYGTEKLYQHGEPRRIEQLQDDLRNKTLAKELSAVAMEDIENPYSDMIGGSHTVRKPDFEDLITHAEPWQKEVYCAVEKLGLYELNHEMYLKMTEHDKKLHAKYVQKVIVLANAHAGLIIRSSQEQDDDLRDVAELQRIYGPTLNNVESNVIRGYGNTLRDLVDVITGLPFYREISKRIPQGEVRKQTVATTDRVQLVFADSKPWFIKK